MHVSVPLCMRYLGAVLSPYELSLYNCHPL